MPYDLAIIGCGIAGLAVSFRIKNKKVILLGRPELAASHCATGVSTHKGITVARGELFQLKQLGHHHLPKWIAEISEATNQSISLIYGIEERFLNEQEIHDIQWRIYKEQPLENFSVKKTNKGFIYPEDFIFNVAELLNALLEHAKKNHSIHLSHVESILRRPDYYEIKTKKGAILSAKNILLACGKDANSLLDQLGLTKLDLRYLAGKTFYGAVSPGSVMRGFTHKGRNLGYFSDHFRLGSTTTTAENLPEDDLNDFEALSSHFEQGLLLEHKWTGTRTRFSDRLPRILELEKLSENQKIFFIGGFYKSGFQFADIFAQKFCDLFLK